MSDHSLHPNGSHFWIALVLTVIWWGCAVAVTVLMKAALSGLHCASSSFGTSESFPYPITLTMFSNMTTAALIDITCTIRDQWVRRVEARTAAQMELCPDTPSTDATMSQYASPNSEASSTPMASQGSINMAPRRDLQFLIAMGLMQGLSLASKNTALLLLSVSTRTMIFATNVLITMTIATISGMETCSKLKILAAILLTAGGAMQAISHVQNASVASASASPDKPLGYLLAALALTLDASRWVLLQNMFKQRDEDRSFLGYMPPAMGSPPTQPHMQALLGLQHRFNSMSHRAQARIGGGGAASKLRMVSAVMWSSSPVVLSLSLICEPGAIATGFDSVRGLGWTVFYLALGVMGINVCEFGVVQETSAVTFTILSNLHSIPMMLSGIVCFGDPVHALEIGGFSVCILGSLVYSLAKSMEKRRSRFR